MSFVRMIQEQLSACFKNACPDNKRLRVRIIQESCPDVTRIINQGNKNNKLGNSYELFFSKRKE